MIHQSAECLEETPLEMREELRSLIRSDVVWLPMQLNYILKKKNLFSTLYPQNGFGERGKLSYLGKWSTVTSSASNLLTLGKLVMKSMVIDVNGWLGMGSGWTKPYGR